MEIIFVLDDHTIFVRKPEELKLQQIENNLSALVVSVGKDENGEELLRPLVTYPVGLVVPPPQKSDYASVDEITTIKNEVQNEAPVVKKKRKKKQCEQCENS